MRQALPDKIYLYIEEAIDKIIIELIKEQRIDPGTTITIGREFRFKLEEEMINTRGKKRKIRTL